MILAAVRSFASADFEQILLERSSASTIKGRIRSTKRLFLKTTDKNSPSLNMSFKKEKNIFGSKGPRKFQILTPTFEETEYTVVKPVGRNDNLAGMYMAGSKSVTTMVNNPPQWSEGKLKRTSGICP